MPSNDTDRAKYVAELRAFADLVESNPAIPAPNFGNLWAFIHAEKDGPSERERFEQVHDFAEAFGVQVTADYTGDRKAKATFGLITLAVCAYADEKPKPHVVTRPIRPSEAGTRTLEPVTA